MVQSEGVTQLEGLLAECEVRIDASPETVFDFFVDADKMRMWKGVRAELDPTPGGVFRVHVSPEWIASGEFVAVERPGRVAFTWGWENNAVSLPPGSTLVDITLVADGDGTIVRLRHSGLPDSDAVRSHTEGWTHFLARLQIVAAGGDPGPDPWATGGEQA